SGGRRPDRRRHHFSAYQRSSLAAEVASPGRETRSAPLGRAPADGAGAFRAGSTDGRWAARSVVDRLGSPAEPCACSLMRSASAIQRIPSAIHRALDVSDQVGAEIWLPHPIWLGELP